MEVSKELQMNRLEKIRAEVKSKFSDDTTGHDWFHIERVVNMALFLQEGTDADREIVELAALLHDIADHKFHDNDFELGAITSLSILLENGYTEDFSKKVAAIVRQVSYKGAKVEETMDSLEGKIVQDADRLDAIGAIGIARAFSFGGAHSRPFFLPDTPPVLHTTKEAYANGKSHSVNHFYEKLLLLKDRLHTDKAKEIGSERHLVLENFLSQFHYEWNFNTVKS
jgi:uncharacterized protein